MRLLLNLITSLSDEEAAKVNAMRLRGKQLAVMELAFSKRFSNTEPTAHELAALGVTESHLYEMCSVILQKVHFVLVPEGGISLLRYLTYKNLVIQTRQELRRQEKELVSTKGIIAEDFYFNCFEILHRFSYNLLDWELIAEYGQKYLSAKQDSDKEDALMLDARTLQSRMIGILADAKNYFKEQGEVYAKLVELEKVARSAGGNIRLCYNVYIAIAWYWQHLGDNAEKALYYLQLAIPYSERLEGPLFNDAISQVQMRLGDAYFSLGRISQAYEIYDRIFLSSGPGDEIWKRYFYVFRYIEMTIFLGKNDRAERLLNEHFLPLLTQRPTSTSATAANLFSLFHILKGDMEKAKEYLNIALELNVRTNFTLYNEVRNRFIEACYSYLLGDWDQTLTLTHRALQYLRGKNIGLNRHIFGYNFKIIEASIEYYSKGTPFWHKFEEKYQFLVKPKEGLFGKLLQRVRSTPRPKT